MIIIIIIILIVVLQVTIILAFTAARPRERPGGTSTPRGLHSRCLSCYCSYHHHYDLSSSSTATTTTTTTTTTTCTCFVRTEWPADRSKLGGIKERKRNKNRHGYRSVVSSRMRFGIQFPAKGGAFIRLRAFVLTDYRLISLKMAKTSMFKTFALWSHPIDHKFDICMFIN